MQGMDICPSVLQHHAPDTLRGKEEKNCHGGDKGEKITVVGARGYNSTAALWPTTLCQQQI